LRAIVRAVSAAVTSTAETLQTKARPLADGDDRQHGRSRHTYQRQVHQPLGQDGADRQEQVRRREECRSDEAERGSHGTVVPPV
jgi:hypothetical protein